MNEKNIDVINLKNILLKVEKKIKWEIAHLDGGIPYIPKNGKYSDKGAEDISWWTNGFWGGLLWQLYSVSHEPIYKEAAENVETRLDHAMLDFNDLHHDVGFMWHLTSVARFKLFNKPKSKSRALHAANILAGRFNVKGEYIRCWNDDEAVGWVIIDSLMNMPLLYWASNETHDPRFKEIAIKHVDTVLNYMVREDGSCSHIAVFNPNTGDYIEELAGQGYASNSSWTRGQSWALYGLTLSYYYTKNQRYLDAAVRVAHYFINNVIHHDYIPPVDFRGEKQDQRKDTSAGLCAVCGLLELSNYVHEADANIFTTVAHKIFTKTTESFANFDLEHDGIIGGGTVAYHRDIENNVPIIYTDFFYVEALLKMSSSNFKIW